MEILINIWKSIAGNFGEVAEAIAYIIAGATIIVKLTPTLKDDAYLKTVVKFVGKYIALNK